jgi:hypothetical protein
MHLEKIKGPTTMRWCYVETGSEREIDWSQVNVTVNLPYPPPNPLVFTMSVTGCASTLTITSCLTDSHGVKTYATVSPPPPPINVTFPPLPKGNYTLTIQVQCGSQNWKQISDISLPDPSKLY